MVESVHRPTKIHINQAAIRKNLARMRTVTPQQMAVFAVVKANGYGHGAVPVAKIAEQSGVQGFCVATIDEGIELREAGITLPILILGLIETSALGLVSDYQLAIPLATNEWLAEALTSYQATPWQQPISVHVALETGMGRIGFQEPQAVQQALATMQEHQGFLFEGIFTHFATADQVDTTDFEQQVRRFHEFLAVLPKQPKYIHTANSATQIWHEVQGNLVRYGVAMYGLNPSGTALPLAYELEPALSLTSKLVQVKQVPKGSGIGYGHTYIAHEAEWIGTIPIGYADGYVRRLQGFHVLIEGEYCEIVGRVCMDQIMVKLPRAIPVGANVTLVGKDGQHEITLQDMASFIGTIHYEVACLFSARLPRVYE